MNVLGLFPPGITPDNILDQQLPRNRRIAETFARCGLIERSGQGAERIVEKCVRHGQRGAFSGRRVLTFPAARY